MTTYRSDPKYLKWVGSLVSALICSSVGVAGEASVLNGELRRTPSGTYEISATILHSDTGWDHYADAFEVVAPDGTVLATRILLHPHVNEQPFTRSLAGVEIPQGITHVIIRAKDSVHGLGGAEIVLDVVR